MESDIHSDGICVYTHEHGFNVILGKTIWSMNA